MDQLVLYATDDKIGIATLNSPSTAAHTRAASTMP
jgi:hypothetical protein